jgi:hypothetical protein
MVLPLYVHSDFDQRALSFAEPVASLLSKGCVYEYLNDEERAPDSFYDALLFEEENPELNKNIGN